MAGAPGAGVVAETGTGKRIVLFSDGTGNSSGKLFKTNVWRTYEAVDLGPAAPGRRPQIAFYDNGVGTSSFKPLAAIGGIFGYGLKRNILEIYRYACRNYQAADGDEIFGFGFSRGAFTMRLVIALIASQGLVVSDNEADLARKSRDAYRCFRRDFKPRSKWAVHTQAYRAVREWSLSIWRKWRGIPLYDSAENHHPTIRFVGVWDTVAAYGGPITEITRAIDNWFYALSMPDYELSPKVRAAAHALAIDDERDAFHPLVWDQVHEEKLVIKGDVTEDRLKQVWFTGMHADVGGGYPDESLSYVSLLWMLNEAEKCGLRTLTAITDRFLALANSAGPIHNSRSGPGGYYRYQPRKIAAWMTKPDIGSLYQRDPEHPGGYLPTVLIHESVAARIAHGTDRYAPITLPAKIQIVPAGQGSEAVPQSDSVSRKLSPIAQAALPMLDPELRRRFESAEFGAERVNRMEEVWDLVWRRRIAYFTTLGLTLLLALLPLWVAYAPTPPVLADGRTWLGEIIRLVNLFIPQFAEGWINVAAANSFYVLVLGILITGSLSYSRAKEGRLRDRAHAIWQQTLGLAPRQDDDCPSAKLRLRTWPAYQHFMQWGKWRGLPCLFAVLILLFLGWALLSLITQAALPVLERNDTLCDGHGSTASLTATRFDFRPSALCVPTRLSVTQGEKYLVDLEVVVPWKDGGINATPEGLPASALPFPLGYLGVTLRRVVNAAYLQPAYLIRMPQQAWQVGPAVFIQPLSFKRGETGTKWHAAFTAERSGELSLFANDSMLPFGDRGFFYEKTGGGNQGSACVTIVHVGSQNASPPPPAAGSACQRAAVPPT